jgi:hypothetical protein
MYPNASQGWQVSDFESPLKPRERWLNERKRRRFINHTEQHRKPERLIGGFQFFNMDYSFFSMSPILIEWIRILIGMVAIRSAGVRCYVYLNIFQTYFPNRNQSWIETISSKSGKEKTEYHPLHILSHEKTGYRMNVFAHRELSLILWVWFCPPPALVMTNWLAQLAVEDFWGTVILSIRPTSLNWTILEIVATRSTIQWRGVQCDRDTVNETKSSVTPKLLNMNPNFLKRPHDSIFENISQGSWLESKRIKRIDAVTFVGDSPDLPPNARAKTVTSSGRYSIRSQVYTLFSVFRSEPPGTDRYNDSIVKFQYASNGYNSITIHKNTVAIAV